MVAPTLVIVSALAAFGKKAPVVVAPEEPSMIPTILAILLCWGLPAFLLMQTKK